MSYSTFGTYVDTPGGIEFDSAGLDLRFTRTDGTTGTISWSVPADGIYNGIVIIGSEGPISQIQKPVNGQSYIPDPTMDRDVHMGDMINSALVIVDGWGDKLSQTATVTGLIPGKTYYFGGFAVDNVRQYSSGSYSYSLDINVAPTVGYDPYAKVIYPKELTDLVALDAGSTYSFKVELGDGDNIITYDIVIDQSIDNITTFESLIAAINDKLMRLQANYTSSVAPNTNNLYLSGNVVNMWDGYVGIPQPTIFSTNNPAIPSLGDVWYDGTTFYQYDGSSYVARRTIVSVDDPRAISCDTFWINDTNPVAVQAANMLNGVWIDRTVYQQSSNPLIAPSYSCNSIWYDGSSFKQFVSTDPNATTCSNVSGYWLDINVSLSSTDPSSFVNGSYWFNPINSVLKTLVSGVWVVSGVDISTTQPSTHINPWYNPSNRELRVWNGTTLVYDLVVSATSTSDPIAPPPGNLWFDGVDLHRWNSITSSYTIIPFIDSPTDPLHPTGFIKGDVWWDGTTAHYYDGSQFVATNSIVSTTDPSIVSLGDFWFNPVTNSLKQWDGATWVSKSFVRFPTNPSLPIAGTFWYDGTTVKVWNGIAWTAVILGPSAPASGFIWYDLTKLLKWNGTTYEDLRPDVVATHDAGDIKFTGISVQCAPMILITDGNQPTPTSTMFGLFKSTRGIIQRPVSGLETVDGTPSYSQVGVGTDGNQAHRRELSQNLLYALGYPSIQVELSKPQLQFCIDQALQEFRRRSSMAYQRNYFFIQLEPGIQHYSLTNKCVGYNTVVSVMEINRVNATFLGKAEGHGAFGQLIMQQLYQMGTFDMVSYHIMSDYMETLEMVTAGRMQFKWNEDTRKLSLMQRVVYPERVMIDAVVEKTEQSIMQSRWSKNWILNWTIAEAKQILAGIRGKFSTVPGANGGVSLNASDLQAQADKLFEQCKLEVDEYVASDPENWGIASTMVVG